MERVRAFVRWVRDHPFAIDVALAGGILVFTTVLHVGTEETRAFDHPPADQSLWTMLLVLATSIPLLARRIAPLTTLVVVLGSQLIADMTYVFGPNWLGAIVAIYSAGAYSIGRRRLAVAAAGLVGVGTSIVIGVGRDDLEAVDGVAAFGVVTAAFVVGDNMRRRREHVVDLAERAERAERERDLIARERVAEERSRIARELHDVVAHSVSAIVIQARAGRRNVRTDADCAEEMLGSIEQTGRQAMNELRRVLGVLRDIDGSDPLGPQPSLGELDGLFAANADLPVQLRVDGDVGDVPAGLGLSAYRIVQEALTNVRRHGGAVTRVDVNIEAGANELRLEILDDGRGAAANARHNDGFGLIGMRERMAASGGELEVGPRAGGGWRVSAAFPREHV